MTRENTSSDHSSNLPSEHPSDRSSSALTNTDGQQSAEQRSAQQPSGVDAATHDTIKSTDSLTDLIKNQLKDHDPKATRSIPPLEKWNPAICGSMNLTVKANGEWWHEGAKITRQPLINLFATVLWREQADEQSVEQVNRQVNTLVDASVDAPVDNYYLKTPGEKLLIEVEDVPLLVTRIEKVSTDGRNYLTCITQTNDVVVIDQQHPVFMRDYAGESRPYITVRRNIEALIHRNAFYHLLEEGEFVEQDGQTVVIIKSGDAEICLSAGL